MKWFGVTAILLAACTSNMDRGLPEAPGQVLVDRPIPLAFASFKLAPGDTLVYNLSWGAGARATGYLLTMTATGAGWGGLPSNLAIVGTTTQVKAINTTAWDTVTFRAVVRSTNSKGTSKDSSFVSWKVQRGPGAPGPITVDSSLIQLSLFIKPDSVQVFTTQSVQLCCYMLALDGKIRMCENQNTITACQQIYDGFPASQRLSGYPVALQHRALNENSIRIALEPQRNGWAKPEVSLALR